MARGVVGLDIGTNAVRVAVLEGGDRPRMRTFGQVALPPEAMREGEIADPGAVTHAIERLWKELDLKRGDVRVGIASPRVIVRPVELPAMDEKDLAGALRFQAQELIPIPIEDAVFDFQVLEHSADGDGNRMQRVLLAAAQREPVQRLVDVVRAARLNPTAVDLVPLALVRSLGFNPVGDQATEAIVSIGAGVTVIVVHEAGLPRFVRILGVGGRVLTEVAARDLELSADVAEALKRRVAEAPAALLDRARGVLDRPLGDLLDEVRGSLDYYRTQPDSVPVRRVVLTGGTALLPEVPERLATLVNLPVVLGSPRDLIDARDTGFTPQELPALDPFFAVPSGIALGGFAADRRINLMPQKVGTAETPRALRIAAAVTVCAVLGGIGLLSFGRLTEQSDAQDARAAQEATNAKLSTDIERLAPVQKGLDSINGAQTRLAAVYATEVDWTQILDQVAAVMPGDVALTGFRGTTQTAAGATGTAPNSPTGAARPTSGPTAQMNFQGRALSYDAVAAWISQLQKAPSLDSVWVSRASQAGGDGASSTSAAATGITFESEAKLAAGTQSPHLAELQAQREG